MSYLDHIVGLEALLKKRKAIDESISDQKDIILARQPLVRLGDTLETNGYSHAGKSFVVDSIVFGTRYNSNVIVASGLIIKKCGGFGVMRGERQYDILNKDY